MKTVRLCILAAVCLLGALPAYAASSFVEDVQVFGKSVVKLNVGHTHRFVTVSPEEGRLTVSMRIDVDVSLLVMNYHRHSQVDAWYDARGLVRFATDITENKERTILSGQRVRVLHEREVMRLHGVIKGHPIDKDYPLHLFSTTSVENYPLIALDAQQPQTFRVLDLFSGDILLVDIMPKGRVACPAPVKGTCLAFHRQSSTLIGDFYYTEDGMLVGAAGDDELGGFEMKANSSVNGQTETPAETEPVEAPPETPASAFGRQLLQSFFGSGQEPAPAPAP